jgi:hypothetical protein
MTALPVNDELDVGWLIHAMLVSQGASTAALPYFICLGFQLPPNENPADFFLDIVSGCVACHANPDFQIEVHNPHTYRFV